MTYLRCRITKRCPWKVDDESYDSEGQRSEHERECAEFAAPLIAAQTLELERLILPTRARKKLSRLYRIGMRAGVAA